MIARGGVFAGFCLELTKRQKPEVEVAQMEISGTAQVKQVEKQVRETRDGLYTCRSQIVDMLDRQW